MKSTITRYLLARSITRAASRQTYSTIRFLADGECIEEAYRAYAYFRWLDDRLDSDLARTPGALSRISFLQRQKFILEACYRGEPVSAASTEEQLLIDLVQGDPRTHSGLETYLRNMMQVMEFDAARRGRLISRAELNEYTRWLATAVTEAMHYFIGHDCDSPHDETRYLAVSGAHIAHMLRDTFEDLQAGYYNIPREVLEAEHIQPGDTQSRPYRLWVRSRVQLAREYFRAGRDYLARVESARCRLAGFAYMARFEWLLDAIEREAYLLRPAYDECKSLRTGWQMGLDTFSALMGRRETQAPPRGAVSPSWRKG